MKPAQLLCALLLLLAGCSGAPPAGPDSPPLALAFLYGCPSGPSSDPCPTTLSAEATLEPAAAIDARDPRRMAVAASVANPTGNAAVRGCALNVWTTDDGGAHWQATTPTLPPLEGTAALGSRCPHSASVAFDAAGRLHLVAFDSVTDVAGQQPLAARNVYTRSDDLGRTWDGQVILFDESNHPWITVAPSGTLVVTSRSGAWAKIARSQDGGTTWTRHEHAELDGCILPSRAASAGHELLFACARYEGPGPQGRIDVVRVDDRTGAVEVRGSVPFLDPVEIPAQDDIEYVRPYLAGFPDGRAVVHYAFYGSDRTDAYLSTSVDGGRTWGATVDAADVLESRGGDVDLIHAAGPAGSTHLWALTWDAAATDLAHVVLDAGGLVVHRGVLFAGLAAPTVPPDDELKGFVYEGAGFAWEGTSGLLVWEHPPQAGELRLLHLVARPAGGLPTGSPLAKG